LGWLERYPTNADLLGAMRIAPQQG
jgi:hypothetical protein